MADSQLPLPGLAPYCLLGGKQLSLFTFYLSIIHPLKILQMGVVSIGIFVIISKGKSNLI